MVTLPTGIRGWNKGRWKSDERVGCGFNDEGAHQNQLLVVLCAPPAFPAVFGDGSIVESVEVKARQEQESSFETTRLSLERGRQ